MSITRTTLSTLLAGSLAVGLIGCGSSDGTSNNTTTIDGSVFASAVSGASCEFQDSLGVAINDSFMTSADGTYSVVLPNASLANDLMLVCTGGTYTDEVRGSTGILAGTMAAYIAADTLSAGSSVHATPGSTIVYHMMNPSGSSTPILTTELASFNTAFGYTPDTSIAPTDATNPDAGATEEQLLAGLRAAAFSQLTSDLVLPEADQFALLEALARDLTDSKLDGKKGSGAVSIVGVGSTAMPVDIQNLFATAFLNFHDNPIIDNAQETAGNDMTGLTADKIGTLPLGKIAITDNYQIEYVEGSMMAMQGKTKFQITLTDPAGTTPQPGVMVMVMPMMYMSTKSHTTPVDGPCTDGNGDGTYDCTVYYVMPTMMGGYWDLKVMANLDEAHFIPEVMMEMGDTPVAMLKNSNLTMNMMGEIKVRTFQIFKSSLTGTTGDHTFELFTTTMETMMSFPAVYTGAILNATTPNELTITPMEVLVSTDPAFLTNVYTASEDGNGYWTAAAITGLTNSVEGTLYVQVTINSHVLNSSIDGVFVDGVTPEYGTFTVTPKMTMP